MPTFLCKVWTYILKDTVRQALRASNTPRALFPTLVDTVARDKLISSLPWLRCFSQWSIWRTMWHSGHFQQPPPLALIHPAHGMLVSDTSCEVPSTLPGIKALREPVLTTKEDSHSSVKTGIFKTILLLTYYFAGYKVPSSRFRDVVDCSETLAWCQGRAIIGLLSAARFRLEHQWPGRHSGVMISSDLGSSVELSLT